jgi:hypothetical protein
MIIRSTGSASKGADGCRRRDGSVSGWLVATVNSPFSLLGAMQALYQPRYSLGEGARLAAAEPFD